MEPETIEAKNWLAFPIAPLTPAAPDQQKSVAIVSGVAVFTLHGSGSDWTHDAVRLPLDDMTQEIFTIAQRTPSAGHHLRFVVERTANFAAINTINAVSANTASNGSEQRAFGFAVDAVETNTIGHTIHCFDGLTITVAILGEQAQLSKVGFQSTLTGWIREFRTRDELG